MPQERGPVSCVGCVSPCCAKVTLEDPPASLLAAPTCREFALWVADDPPEFLGIGGIFRPPRA